jgi:hypothetical protein
MSSQTVLCEPLPTPLARPLAEEIAYPFPEVPSIKP